jgi:hypothetical protein
MDRCAKTPPLVSQPSTDGPGDWVNPAKLGKIDNHKQEPWKLPLPQFIEQLYFERFGKTTPDNVVSIDERCRVEGRKQKRDVPPGSSEGQTLKPGERRPRYCGAALRGADSAATRGGDVRRSCRIGPLGGTGTAAPNQWRLSQSRLWAGAKPLSNRKVRHHPSGRFQFLLDIE